MGYGFGMVAARCVASVPPTVQGQARMNFEKSSLKQRALLAALVLWATACGGTAFSEAGSAGAGGTASGGTDAGGTGAGGSGVAGTGPVCNVACPLILCDGASVKKPGECCPTCEPSGGAGGGSNGGSVGVGGCASVACLALGCAPGWTSVYEPGACCPTCVPSGSAGSGGTGGCVNISCPAFDCAPGYILQQQAGACCPSCVPKDDCALGQQSYDMLRQKLLAQPGALACKLSTDCTLLSGNAYCGDQCSQAPVNAAAAQSIDSELGTFATNNCSTCTPIYPPCAAPLAPVCVQGQCVAGHTLN